MVNNRSKLILGLIGTFSILVLIAGAVMLAIGVTKFNDAKTTTSTSATTRTTFNAVVSNWIVDPNSTEVAAFLYNTQQPKVIGRPFLYYNVKTLILDLLDQLQSFTYFQPDISFGISTLIDNLQNRRLNIPLVTILFTYSSEYDDVVSAVTQIPILNSSLIIVAVGPNANLNILQYLSGTVVLSNTDYSNAGLVNTINTAICEPSDPPKPTPAPTTTPPATTTTPASSAPYLPCQKYIAFIIDASNDLTDGEFAMQKGAVGLALPQANHYERFAFGYYASTANVFDFGRFDSDTSFTNSIAGTKQTNNPPNITRALQAADIGLTVNNTVGLSIIIFITKPNPVDISAAIPFAQSLQSKGKLTVVALLNANITLIKQLTSNIVLWSDMGSYNTTTWIPDMQNAFGCLNDSSTIAPVTSTRITTTTAPSQPPTLSSTTIPQPGGPYWPCESDIVIAVDVSSSMSYENFQNEGLFIVINFVNYNWTHYERVGLMSYADGYNRVRKGDTFNHDSTINNPVLQMAQQPGKNNITEGLSIVVANFSQGQHFFRNTVFFTSASDHDDVTKAVPFATQISQKGPLIIIAYSENEKMWCSLTFFIFLINYAKSEAEYGVVRDDVSTMFDIAGIFMKSMSLIDPNLSFTTYTTASKCSNGSIPVAFAIKNDGIRVITCKLAECLDPKRVVCEKIDGIHKCDLENEWVSGFIDTFSKIHKTETECCRYRAKYALAFIK
uniref:VWFA domain-containing protein n=1 Tax=Panagrolaimus sp. PS1159 TaxID=55785 RepID=A0AC35GCW2_9BILA